MAMNILAPILMINLYKGYTAESFIVGSPDKSVVITEYVEPKDYLYQENLSSLTFVQEDEYWVASYNFEDREFDIEKTYAIFVNDYICTPVDVLGSKVSGTHTIKFNDINNDTLDITKMSIDFEFYTTYSSILLKVETADITYFNGFKQNPGFILTLTEIDPNLLEIVKNTTITITPEEPDENVVAVTFKSYDDSVLNTYYVEVGNTLSTTPDEPTRAGYVFQGWTLDGANIVDDLSTLTFSENTTFTAVWQAIHTIQFYSEGVKLSEETVLDGGYIINIPNSPVKDGYEFKGWSVDGQIVAVESLPITSSMVLIAVFEEPIFYFQVTFDASILEVPDSFILNYYNGAGTVYVQNGDQVASGITLCYSYNPQVFSKITFEGIDESSIANYQFVLTNNIVVYGERLEQEVEDTQCLITINGVRKYFGPINTGINYESGQIVEQGTVLWLDVYDYRTEDVSITAGNYTVTHYEAKVDMYAYTRYEIVADVSSLEISIIEKEVYDTASVAFNLIDYESQGYSFKVYCYDLEENVTYDIFDDHFKHARELSDGDTVAMGKIVYVLVYQDNSLLVESSSNHTTPLTKYNNGCDVYSYKNGGTVYAYCYIAYSNTLIIQ